jgi:uncharacterized protein (TIGR02646 family)
MRTIVKGREPASLTEHRSSPGANYENYRDKDTLRTNLVNEQRGLCCYCLSRIRAERGKMKIEHWHCQDYYPSQQLDYSNLLGACMGNEGKLGRDQHCDTRKGNRDLSRNPANQMDRVEEWVRFGGDGRVYSNDRELDRELNDVLNLNLAFLMNNRKATLTGFIDALPRAGSLQRTTLERWLRRWNGESGTDELQEYCQVIVYWLRKRLARR